MAARRWGHEGYDGYDGYDGWARDCRARAGTARKIVQSPVGGAAPVGFALPSTQRR